MAASTPARDFSVQRLGVIMSALPGNPREAWGVLNPGGARSADGAMHLFPRLVAEGNFSRIGHARVRYEGGNPAGVDRLGIALEPTERYEVGPAGGGLEDPRVVYVAPLKRFVMTYTAYVPHEPRVAIAVSEDLETWVRLGLLTFEPTPGMLDLNHCGNKDAAVFPDIIADPEGVPSIGILHRPTTRIRIDRAGSDVTMPPSGEEMHEHIWISYVAVDAVLADLSRLTCCRRHEGVMAPEQPWESEKVGTGAPPLRRDYGWVVPYHAVSSPGGHDRYCMGIAILDLERPSRVLFRSPEPVLEPETDYERNGVVSDVVFPTATGLRADGQLEVYYGAADRVIAAALVTLPDTLPPQTYGAGARSPDPTSR